MAHQPELAEVRQNVHRGENMNHIRVSSSIYNFKWKLLRKYPDYNEWGLRALFKPTLFFGLYHTLDYLAFILHRGKRAVFWCGSDIKALEKRPFWAFLLRNCVAFHYVENRTEYGHLRYILGFPEPEVHPMFFGNHEEYTSQYQHSFKPHVFISGHELREKEYGLHLIEEVAKELPAFTFHVFGTWGLRGDNVKCYGKVPEARFDAIASGCQAGLRLNTFDGFSEVTAKSILWGQYPITAIHYNLIDWAPNLDDLKEKLKLLTLKDKPNTEVRRAWIRNYLCKRVEV